MDAGGGRTLVWIREAVPVQVSLGFPGSRHFHYRDVTRSPCSGRPPQGLRDAEGPTRAWPGDSRPQGGMPALPGHPPAHRPRTWVSALLTYKPGGPPRTWGHFRTQAQWPGRRVGTRRGHAAQASCRPRPQHHCKGRRDEVMEQHTTRLLITNCQASATCRTGPVSCQWSPTQARGRAR